MKRDTKKVGIVSELKVMAALAEAGYRLFIPYGDSMRYDVVIEDGGGKFARVQIKTGRLKNGVILFNAFSSHTHRGGLSTRNYVGEVEFFGVYCPQNARCYLVPAENIRTRDSLRVVDPRNGQAAHVRWASGYELPRSADSAVGTWAGSVVPLGA